MKPLIAAGALLLATVFAAAAPAADFALDPSHTSIVFGVKHLSYSYTYGRFNKMSGSFSLEPDGGAFALTIDAASVDTNDPKRDDHLRGPDFFNAAQFPAITFKSDKVTVKQDKDGEVYTVVGKLTLHGETRPLTLELRKLGEGDSPFGDYRAGFLVQTKLLRSDFGMKGMTPAIGDEVLITISFEGVRKGAQ
ncbi:MAG: YceI family protein [Planctomycetales bacterium]|nr:YceI family protein [Planctomycetales bacterium]